MSTPRRPYQLAVITKAFLLLVSSFIFIGCMKIQGVVQDPSKIAALNVLEFNQTTLAIAKNSSNVVAVTMKQTRPTDTPVTLTLTSLGSFDMSKIHLSSNSLVIAAGEVSADVTIAVDPGTVFTGPQQFKLIATTDVNIQFQNANILLTVTDNEPAPSLAIANSIVATNAGHIDFHLTLTPNATMATSVSVSYSTTDGSAAAGTDYSAAAGTVTFAAGETSKTISVPLLNRSLAVVPKNFTVRINSDLATLTSSVATGTLVSPLTAVTINQSLTQPDPTNALPVRFDVVFSQPVDPTTFTTTALTQTGTASGIGWTLTSSDNQSWVLSATSIGGDGTVEPSLASNIVKNPLGAGTNASVSVDNSVVYDSTPPTVTVEQALSQADPATSLPIIFNVAFSEPIKTSTFTTASITQTGNAAGVTWSITNSGDDKNFILKAITATADGTVTPVILANAVTDPAGNGNVHSTSVDNEVSFGIVVLPVYEKNGGDWNSYVKNNGTNSQNATGVACDGSETSYRNCLHGGELKKVILPSFSSCSGLTLTDYQGWFDWTCNDSSGLATFYSSALKSGKSLQSLIKADGTNWQTNYVIVSGGGNFVTPALNWWPNNPVLALPDNSAPTAVVSILNTPKAVYTLTASRTSQGYNIAADGISLLTLGSAKLTYGGSTAHNCNNSTGSTTAANTIAMVCSGSHSFAWFEANIDAYASSQSAHYTFFLANGRNLRMQNTLASNGLWTGIEMHQVANSKFKNVQMNGSGASLYSSNGNLFMQTTIARSGWSLNDSSNNVISQTRVSNCYVGYGINGASTGNSFFEALLFNFNGYGIQPNSSTENNNIVAFATVLNSTQAGIAYWNGSQNTFHNVLVSNNGNQGIITFASHSSYSHLAVADNINDGFQLDYGINNKFSGLLLAGNNSTGNCQAAGGSAGIDTSCNGTGASAGLLTVVQNASITAASTFVGKVSSDSANTSANSGTATYPANPAVFDWLNFYNPFAPTLPMNLMRGWAIGSASSFPNSVYRSNWNGGSGRIWDFSLLASDPAFLNKTQNGVSVNDAIVEGAACPAWLNGNTTITDQSGHTFLANAYELVDDGIGNDNGLCESGEACVAAPNFGAYQGHGDYTGHTCIFNNGTVSNVKMYFMPTNGF